ncbi:MAG: hypothetical protein WC389_20735 [Lutibacter sp.]
MGKLIDPYSEEYLFLINNINIAINIYDMDFSISRAMKYIVAQQLGTVEFAKIQRILNKIHSNEVNPVLKKVFEGYYCAIRDIVNKDMKLAFYVFSILGFSIKFFEKSKEEIIQYKKDVLDSVLPIAA